MTRDVFQAIADQTGRDILVILTGKAITPNELTANFHTTRQTISKPIKILSECRFVKQEYSGREIYYYFKSKKFERS